MGKFDRGGFGGGKKFVGRDRSFDRNAPRQMFKAVCADCGNECEVPFKPSGDRPVLCSICFKQSHGGDRDDRREDRGSFDRPRNEGDRKMYDATCAECGQHCQVPFQPKPGRDIFCSDCFGRDNKSEPKPFIPNQASKSASYDRQFEALHAKLDKIINYLNPSATKPATMKPLEMVSKKEAVKPEVKNSDKKIDKKIAKKEDKKIAKKKIAKKK